MDEVLSTNKHIETSWRTPLCRFFSSQKSEVGPEQSENKSGRGKADKNGKFLMKIPRAAGLAIDVDVSLSDQSEPEWKTKRIYCVSPETREDEGRRKVRSCSTSKVSLVKQDQDVEKVVFSELSSSSYENWLEEDTEIQVQGLLPRQRRLRSEPRRAVNDDVQLPMPRVNRCHRYHSDMLVGDNRHRRIPGAQIRHYYNDIPLRNFRTLGAVERYSCVKRVSDSPTHFVVPLNARTLTYTRGLTPCPRKSPQSLSVDVERNPGKSSDNGPAYPRCGRHSIFRPGSPSARHSKAACPCRIRTAVRDSGLYVVLWSAFCPAVAFIRMHGSPPVFLEQAALFNETSSINTYPSRPPILPRHRLSAQFQEGLCTVKATDVTPAEPDFPRPEHKDTKNEPLKSHSSFQRMYDSAKCKLSGSSLKVIFPETAIVTPSALPRVPSVSSYSEQPGLAMVQRASPHSCLPGDQRFRQASSCDTKAVTSIDIRHSPSLQRDGVTASDISQARQCSSSSTGRNVTLPPGFPNAREIQNEAVGAASTNSIMPSVENRLHREDATAIFGRVVSAALIFLACLFAGIAAAFVIRARRHQPLAIPDNEDSGDLPGILSLPSKIELAGTANRSSCQSQMCSEHVRKLFVSLDDSVHPCRDFYGHVCAMAAVNGTADEQLDQLTAHRVLSFLKATDNSSDGELPLVVASRHLYNECVQLATLNRKEKAPLLKLLNLTGLGDWPYDDDASLPDVWKVAGNLQRLLALSPLFELKGLSGGKLRLVPGHQGGPDKPANVLAAMLTLHHNGSRLRELAADVAHLSRRLKNLRFLRPTSKYLQGNYSEILPQSYLEAALTGLGLDTGAVEIQQEAGVKPLVQLVRDSMPRTVLNLLGYRLMRHVDDFTKAAASGDIQQVAVLIRESRCARAVLEDALTNDEAEFVRYAAVRDRLNFDSIRSIVAEGKRVLDAKLAEQRWLDLRTRRSLRRHLRELKVRFISERYENSGEVNLTTPALALSSGALATYQMFRESRFRSRVLQGAAYDDGGDQECAYDEHKKWSPVALTKLDGLRACLRAQSARRTKPTRLGWGPEQEQLVESAALGPARDVFRTYVERLVGKDHVAQPTYDATRTSREWDQVNHSQNLSVPPMQAWTLVKSDVEVIAVHCSRMARIGEAFSHVAALLFYLECVARARKDRSCTDGANLWLPPHLRKLPVRTIAEMDFSSATMKKRRLDSGSAAVSAPTATSRPAAPAATKADWRTFLAGAIQAGHRPAASSVDLAFKDVYLPAVRSCRGADLRRI
ncbi:hypothetical protein HPB48_026088 [Haemaphysalis longicornis]|uniref:Uncharacterized protein n=1 Tax=Haemaphysalis longicornis TaxID=44386 RepID=A0A9J6H8M5_HAELO|nr:hypothetical protein HPB48_026088 [Haemaphysalis longicornis]